MTDTVMQGPGLSPSIEYVLGAVVKELSEVVERICKGILRDLNDFSALGKEHGKAKLTDMNIRHIIDSSFSSGPFAGTYIGYGLGPGWLNLGILENAVGAGFKEKFEEIQTDYASNEDDDSTGRRYWAYKTRRGAFVLSHTGDGWFIMQRIE